MKAFLCHDSEDTKVVREIDQLLRSIGLETFYYPADQRADEEFTDTMRREARDCEVMIVFQGASFAHYQQSELTTAWNKHCDGVKKHWIFIKLEGISQTTEDIVGGLVPSFRQLPHIIAEDRVSVESVAKKVASFLRVPWTKFGLPVDPELFDYEKSIIEHLSKVREFGDAYFNEPAESDSDNLKEARAKCHRGAPYEWPPVTHIADLPQWKKPHPLVSNPWSRTDGNPTETFDIGLSRPLKSSVSTKATFGDSEPGPSGEFPLPEAGPRENLYFPNGGTLTVGILVSGGIAPGINAVIDGIVQRHWLYAHTPGRDNHMCMQYQLVVRGFQNGFNDVHGHRLLAANITHKNCYAADHVPGQGACLITSEFAHEGGSMIGTSRVAELTKPDTRGERLIQIANDLTGGALNVDILYIIGGDGSMRAAHALSTVARSIPSQGRSPLSVVGVPKTMDNDILWVWQSFGFLSAVEKAKEVIENLYTEVSANPRLGVVQLFGSVSGFVVSHAVLASSTNHCELALIPEVPFSVEGVANHMRKRMTENARDQHHRMPFGLIVMAETAIPSDVEKYLGHSAPSEGEQNPYWVGLTEAEERELKTYLANGRKIVGQTSDLLRSAGLKLMSVGLANLLRNTPDENMKWPELRYLTNEPRHILRAVPPSSSDIINCQRLGILAVDNAMGGYTDFMISQWLTEFVIVPLSLVVLGRKKIYTPGIFWKSVIAKTEQHTTDLNETAQG